MAKERSSLEQAIDNMETTLAEIEKDRDSYFAENIFQDSSVCMSIIKNSHCQKITTGYMDGNSELVFIELKYDFRRAEGSLFDYLAEQLPNQKQFEIKMRIHLLDYQNRANDGVSAETDIRRALSFIPDNFRSTGLLIARLLATPNALSKGDTPKSFLENIITVTEKSTAEYQILHDATTYGVEFFESILTHCEDALSGEEQGLLQDCITVARNIHDISLNLLRCSQREHKAYSQMKDLLYPLKNNEPAPR